MTDKPTLDDHIETAITHAELLKASIDGVAKTEKGSLEMARGLLNVSQAALLMSIQYRLAALTIIDAEEEAHG